jgi:folate-binding Fe-S cluster repair protein YgfZ
VIFSGHSVMSLSVNAVVHDENSAVITVSGPDRLIWLNSLITQEVLGLTPGHTVESLLLNPQGRVEHSFFLTDDGPQRGFSPQPSELMRSKHGCAPWCFGWMSPLTTREPPNGGCEHS